MESSRVSDEVLEAIRTRISLVDLVSSHVALRKAGRTWKGLCPFHGEKTPSFVVNEERGTYHCFGCGAGGTAFRFLMEAEGRTFREAVEILATRAGVTLNLSPETEEEKSAREGKELLHELLSLAARYYRHQLLEGRAGEAARRYLVERGIDEQASEAFSLGCAPEGWDHLARYLARKGFDPAAAAQAGLLTPRTSGGYYDRFRGRLIFPIADAAGRVVSLGGRVLGKGEPKYLNGPESPVFRKSDVLYGLFQGAEALRRDRRALLVEGYVDVVSLHSRGLRPALATMGTALTREHVHTLRRRVDEAVLIYDGDAAGRKATFRSLEVFLSEGFPCRAVLLPPEHDPDSFVRAGGDLNGRIVAARPLFAEFLEELSSRTELGTVEGRLRAVDDLVPSLRALSDPLAKELYVRESAERLGVPEGLLRDRMAAGAPTRGPVGAQPAPRAAVVLDPVEKALLTTLIHKPEHRTTFLAHGVAEWLVTDCLREAALFVAGRTEPAESLPSDEAPEAGRQVLSEILVDEAAPRDAYESLETRLRLRSTEALAADVLREMREVSARGDDDAVVALQRRKMELDRVLVELRKRVGC